eukprot:PhM_4_TR10023/c2_g1_i2/m.94964/K15362/BRIP1, BACH1, FANCJ; fanconi anemia group J protein
MITPKIEVFDVDVDDDDNSIEVLVISDDDDGNEKKDRYSPTRCTDVAVAAGAITKVESPPFLTPSSSSSPHTPSGRRRRQRQRRRRDSSSRTAMPPVFTTACVKNQTLKSYFTPSTTTAPSPKKNVTTTGVPISRTPLSTDDLETELKEDAEKAERDRRREETEKERTAVRLRQHNRALPTAYHWPRGDTAHEPHGVQDRLITTMLSGFETFNHMLVESPTGTGKTLALLAAALTRHTELMRQTPLQIREKLKSLRAQRKSNASSSSSSLADLPILGGSEGYDDDQKKGDGEEYEMESNVTHVVAGRDGLFATLTSAGRGGGRHGAAATRKRHRLAPRGLESVFAPLESGHRQEPSSSTSSLNHTHVPTIFYCSRTHGQLAQVVGELRKFSTGAPSSTSSSDYTASPDVHMNILASRQRLCTNARIRGLLPHERNNLGEMCDKAVAEGQCLAMDLYPQLLEKVADVPHEWTIEDLVEAGKASGGCPYYTARELVVSAHITFCPYNYILDPLVRHETKEMNARLENAIVVFDEGHNVADVCCEALDAELASKALQMILDDLHEYADQQGGASLQYDRSFNGALSNGVTLTDACSCVCAITAMMLQDVLLVGGQRKVDSFQLKALLWKSVDALGHKSERVLFRVTLRVFFSLGVTFNPFGAEVHSIHTIKKVLMFFHYLVIAPNSFACRVEDVVSQSNNNNTNNNVNNSLIDLLLTIQERASQLQFSSSSSPSSLGDDLADDGTITLPNLTPLLHVISKAHVRVAALDVALLLDIPHMGSSGTTTTTTTTATSSKSSCSSNCTSVSNVMMARWYLWLNRIKQQILCVERHAALQQHQEREALKQSLEVMPRDATDETSTLCRVSAWCVWREWVLQRTEERAAVDAWARRVSEKRLLFFVFERWRGQFWHRVRDKTSSRHHHHPEQEEQLDDDELVEEADVSWLSALHDLRTACNHEEQGQAVDEEQHFKLSLPVSVDAVCDQNGFVVSSYAYYSSTRPQQQQQQQQHHYIDRALPFAVPSSSSLSSYATTSTAAFSFSRRKKKAPWKV